MTNKTQVIVYLLTGLIILPVVLTLFGWRDQSLTRIQCTGSIKIGYVVEAPYISCSYTAIDRRLGMELFAD